MVAHTLSIDLELVSVKPSNTLTSPNGMGTAASITSEACAYVSIEMCNNLVFYVLLTVHRGTNLVNNLLDAQFLSIHVISILYMF